MPSPRLGPRGCRVRARNAMSRVKLAALPIHPLLLAAYPVVFLFATNAADQVTLDPLWGPLAIAVGGAAVVLALFTLALRDWHRAALLTTVLVAGFFGYGHAWNAASQFLDNQWPLIGAWALLVGIGLVRRLAFGRLGANRLPRAQPDRRRRPAPQRLERCRRDGGLRRGRSAAARPHRARARPLGPGGSARRLLHHPRPLRRPGRAGGHVRLRQRAVPHGPRGARLQCRAPRPRQLHQDAALARQLSEHGLSGCRCAEGGGHRGQGSRAGPSGPARPPGGADGA